MPRLVNVAELLEDFSRKSRRERAEAVKKIDGDLKEAVRKDMAVYFGVVMSIVAKAGKNPRAPLHHGEHGIAERNRIASRLAGRCRPAPLNASSIRLIFR